MNRREFIVNTGLLTCGASIATGNIFAQEPSLTTQLAALKDHRIDKVDYISAEYHFPRIVGRNSRKGIHGQYKKMDCVKLYTDQGAIGWSIVRSRLNDDELKRTVLGKTVDELFVPELGIRKNTHLTLDLALHDLAGIILNKPVYQMLGAHGPKATKIYSGMIYFDELNAEGRPRGWDKVIANCQWDYDYGYRQFKVKIGRGGKWYPHDEGLAADIKIVKMIHEAFGDKGVEILVDANDAYSLQDTIDFFEGVKDVPIYWMEEPFRENLEKSRALRKWMKQNGRENTYYTDGEAHPDYKLIEQLIIEGTLDMHLTDIVKYGFTKWRKLIPFLKKHNATGSPHVWGQMLKSHYISHLSAGIGGVETIEGVTCISDDIDFGDYTIIDGKLHVSEKPGFGMDLLI